MNVPPIVQTLEAAIDSGQYLSSPILRAYLGYKRGDRRPLPRPTLCRWVKEMGWDYPADQSFSPDCCKRLAKLAAWLGGGGTMAAFKANHDIQSNQEQPNGSNHKQQRQGFSAQDFSSFATTTGVEWR